jgi:hypothetical protein
MNISTLSSGGCGKRSGRAGTTRKRRRSGSKRKKRTKSRSKSMSRIG